MCESDVYILEEDGKKLVMKDVQKFYLKIIKLKFTESSGTRLKPMTAKFASLT